MSSPLSISSTDEHQPLPSGRFKPFVSLRRHLLLMLFVFVVTAAIGYGVTLKKGKSFYVTQLKILVSPKFIANLSGERGMELQRQEYQMFINQQTDLLTRPDVLEAAWQHPDIKENWPLLGEDKTASLKRLASSLDAKSKFNSPFLVISLRGAQPEKLEVVLNAFVDVFMKKSQAENLYDSAGRIAVLGNLRNDLLKSISQYQKRRTQIAEELGVTTFQLEDKNAYDNLLVESVGALAQARRQRIEVEANADALDKKQPGKQSALDTLVQELVDSDPILASFRAKLTERRTELMLQKTGLTPEHPSRKQAEREIVEIEKDIEKATKELSHRIRERLLRKNEAEVYQKITIEKALENELSQQREQVNHYVNLYHEALVLNREIERGYRQLDKVDGRIDFLTIESDAPGFLRLFSAATSPITIGGYQKLALMFALLAFGLAIVVPITVDMLDKRIRTPAEVQNILNFAPMAWILDRHDKATGRLAADCIRRMALTLKREWHTHQTNCFALTAVKTEGGTTTLVLDLAHSLNELGIRTLALEINAFQPDKRYQSLESPYSVADLLTQDNLDDMTPDRWVIPPSDTLPARLPVGETAARYLATQGRLAPLLKYFSTYYDLILLDAPPILLSADAELLGESSGGVVLVIEAEKTHPGELKRAAHILARLNPPVVGAILNRVKVYRGGGYFAELLKEHNAPFRKKSGWLKRLFS